MYRDSPATSTTMAPSMAAAGTANPIAQLMFSWMYTIAVDAIKLPTLILK